MSAKQPDRTKATAEKTDTSETNRSTTKSIMPADLSLDAVTVPPPPPSLTGGAGALSIPRAPRVPTENKPASAPAKPKRSEDDIFSIFDVDSNTASDDIPVSVQQFDKKPEPAPVKPKSQLGTRSSEEREVTRSRQIPIDEDLFNLSVGLFSTSHQAPLVAPDMAALTGAGSSDKASAKDTSTSSLDDLFSLPMAAAAPVAPVESLDLLAPKPAAPEPTTKPSSPRSHRTVLFVGIAAALLITGGVFFFMQSPSPEATASAQPQNTTTENALDTRPGQTPAANEPQTRPAVAEKPQEDPGALAKPDTQPASTGASKEASDKPAAGGNSDKQAGQGKPAEPEATAKPTETAAPTATATAQSLAEAMAAAAGPGGAKPASTPTAPPQATTPPSPSGSEFNKSAATAALNGAAGSASGCKAAGDPAGVARVSVTFAPSGRATRAIVSGPPFAGTPTGSCIAAAFRSISVPAFSGAPVTVSKSVSIR